MQERDPKAHKFLGQLYEREGEINKAIGCYKVGNTCLWQEKQSSFLNKSIVRLCIETIALFQVLKVKSQLIQKHYIS